MQCVGLLLLSLACFYRFTQCSSLQALFSRVDSYRCISAEFVESHSEERSNIGCANLCGRNLRCQAFSLADGPCELFVFDKCSKSVRNCGCTRRGQVFVRKQQGLAAGALCPIDFGYELCGVKYKRVGGGVSGMNWQQGKQKCDSEHGLVIMGDMTSSAEMSHIDSWYSTDSTTPTIWLGGFQLLGSLEPGGGWKWVSCDIGLNASLWGAGEPDNWNNTENVVVRWKTISGLTDYSGGSSNQYVLCECLSPF